MEIHVALSTEYGWAAVRDAAQLAEELHFDGFWLTDLRFAPDCFTVLGALATTTSKIKLVTGVSDPYSRHPAQLAASIATLQEITAGRAVLGRGAGGSNLDRIGITRTKPLGTVAASIEAIRALMRGEPVTMEAPAFRMGDAQLTFPRAAPIGVAAHGPRMYELAGRLADIAIIANVVNADGYAWARANIEKGVSARPPGLGPVTYAWRVDVCLSAVPGRAREFTRRRVRGKLERNALSPEYLRSLGLSELASLAHWSDAEVDAFIDATAFVGTPEEVRHRIAEASDRFGPSLVCCRIDPPPGEDPLEGIRLLDSCFAYTGALS